MIPLSLSEGGDNVQLTPTELIALGTFIVEVIMLLYVISDHIKK